MRVVLFIHVPFVVSIPGINHVSESSAYCRHNKVCYFDGNLPHCTLDITGNQERFSLVYFASRGALSEKFEDTEKQEMVSMGFVLPRDKCEQWQLSTIHRAQLQQHRNCDSYIVLLCVGQATFTNRKAKKSA